MSEQLALSLPPPPPPPNRSGAFSTRLNLGMTVPAHGGRAAKTAALTPRALIRSLLASDQPGGGKIRTRPPPSRERPSVGPAAKGDGAARGQDAADEAPRLPAGGAEPSENAASAKRKNGRRAFFFPPVGSRKYAASTRLTRSFVRFALNTKRREVGGNRCPFNGGETYKDAV